MLNCKDTSRLVSESQERHLSWVERIQLRLHLIICGRCRHFSKNLDSLRTALRQFNSPNADVNKDNHDSSH